MCGWAEKTILSTSNFFICQRPSPWMLFFVLTFKAMVKDGSYIVLVFLSQIEAELLSLKRQFDEALQQVGLADGANVAAGGGVARVDDDEDSAVGPSVSKASSSRGQQQQQQHRQPHSKRRQQQQQQHSSSDEENTTPTHPRLPLTSSTARSDQVH